MAAVLGWESELQEDVADVLVHGPLGDDEPIGDLGVAVSLGHHREYLAFAFRQPAQGVAARREELTDHFGVERGAAGRHPVEGVEEVVDAGDPVLEQVADAGAVGDQLSGVGVLDVL
nr:hypothetical protein [Streptomyces sp. Ag109_G2-6]